MLNINENVSLPSNPMDMSPPIETNNPLDITEKKPDIEENRTLLSSASSSIEQVRLPFFSSILNTLLRYC